MAIVLENLIITIRTATMRDMFYISREMANKIGSIKDPNKLILFAEMSEVYKNISDPNSSIELLNKAKEKAEDIKKRFDALV